MTAARFVVLEGVVGAGEAEALRLRRDGVEVLTGFRGLDRKAGRVVRVGVVADARDAADAVLAAISGAALVVEATADRATIDRLIDDLQRLGVVDHRTGAPDPAPAVAEDARALLGLLAEGYSLGDAAELLGIARRTADRRLAAARSALGARRTTDAIARARRLGWFRRPGGP